MDTNSLKYFMGVAEGQTFWDVAENNNISQSSVSKAILKLEDELGIKLFNRSKRSATLTPAGEIFYNTLKRLEPEFLEAIKNMAQYSSQKTIFCCIVPHEDFCDLRLKIQNVPFSDMYPNVNISITRDVNPFMALTNLNDRKLDYVIGHKLSFLNDQIESIPLFQDTLYAIFPKGHPLAERESVSFEEIYKEHFIIRSLIIKEVLKETCDSFGLPMPPNCTIFEVSSSELKRNQILSRVAFGQGITLYFESDLYPFRLDQVHVCPITDCPEFPVVLSWKKSSGAGSASYHPTFLNYMLELTNNSDNS